MNTDLDYLRDQDYNSRIHQIRELLDRGETTLVILKIVNLYKDGYSPLTVVNSVFDNDPGEILIDIFNNIAELYLKNKNTIEHNFKMSYKIY